jgi:hypothetical protein
MLGTIPVSQLLADAETLHEPIATGADQPCPRWTVGADHTSDASGVTKNDAALQHSIIPATWTHTLNSIPPPSRRRSRRRQPLRGRTCRSRAFRMTFGSAWSNCRMDCGLQTGGRFARLRMVARFQEGPETRGL